jgi:hypothetical protein
MLFGGLLATFVQETWSIQREVNKIKARYKVFYG